MHKLEIPVLRDAGNKIADLFGAQRTPEAFLLDGERKTVFAGRIDDQFTYGIQRSKVEKAYLTDAIDQFVAGKPIEVAFAEPVGCFIGRVLTPKADSEVTYSKQIARILQDNCVRCHRPGEIGPFAMTNYEEVVGWAEMIREVVKEQRMPPWHANPKHGHFRNDSRLSDADKLAIDKWVAAGAPEGNRADLPPAKEYVEGWQIGQPDNVFYATEQPYKVPATGTVRYQYFFVDPGFTEDKWIQAGEARPGNRAVVHHIIVGIIPPGGARGLRGDGEFSDWLVATAPGAKPMVLPTGLAKKVPAGSKLVFQMHYTPNGSPQEDRSCVGLVFADPKTVKQQVSTDKASTHGFAIPPGAGNHKVEATNRFGNDTLVLAFFPHMHLRGKAFRYTAIMPDGKQEVLLDVPHYDFNWQNTYELTEPKLMPRGSQMFCEAWFDNSPENLANPNPGATVRWGDQTWEEMMIGYFSSTPADQKLDLSAAKPQPPQRTQQFVALVKEGKATLSDDLKRQAHTALASDANLVKFGPELRKIAPQLDRMCWTTVEDGKLVIRRCVQEANFDREVGPAGRKIDARLSKLSAYADKTEPTLHQQLASARGFDLLFMARVFGSSLHIPVKIDGQPGTLNFWSTEKDAFPPELVALLTDLAKSVQP
jgi:mono/diheme cytochrome c family protein